MYTRLKNNMFQTQWSMDLRSIQKNIYVQQRSFYINRQLRFGRLVKIEDGLLEARGYSEGLIRDILRKKNHPVIEIPVENLTTGEKGKAIHSFTSHYRQQDMIEFEKRFDSQVKGQYLHNRGDVERESDKTAFEVDWDYYPNKDSVNVNNEARDKLFQAFDTNSQILQNHLVTTGSMYFDHPVLEMSVAHDHFVDWTYNLDEGDLSRLFNN